jgi:MFS family permease
LLRDRAVILASLLGSVTGIVLFVTVTYVPVLVQGAFTGSGLSSGSMVSAFMVSLIGAMVVSNRAIARWGRYRPFALGGSGLMVLSTAGMLLAPRAGSGLTMVVLALLGSGVGMVVQMPVLLIQNAVSRLVLGAATAAAQFVRELGSLAGIAVAGAIFLGAVAASSFGVGNAGVSASGLVDATPAALSAGVTRVFGLVALPAALVALVVSLRLGNAPLAGESADNRQAFASRPDQAAT